MAGRTELIPDLLKNWKPEPENLKQTIEMADIRWKSLETNINYRRDSKTIC